MPINLEAKKHQASLAQCFVIHLNSMYMLGHAQAHIRIRQFTCNKTGTS